MRIRDGFDGEIIHLVALAKRTIADILEIGRRLTAIQDRLADYHDGMFTNWIKKECVWSKSAVYRFIDVYNRFASFPNLGKLTIDPSALYLLASDFTPESARREAIERAEDGEMMTHAKAKAIVKAHQPPRFTMATAPYAPDVKTLQPDQTPPSIDRQIDAVLSAATALKDASEQSPLTTNQKRKIGQIIEVLLSIG